MPSPLSQGITAVCHLGGWVAAFLHSAGRPPLEASSSLARNASYAQGLSGPLYEPFPVEPIGSSVRCIYWRRYVQVEFSSGDIIEVNSKKLGGPVRRGKVTEVVDPASPRLRVVWEDERESVFSPAGGMIRVVGREGD
ncbi:MAG: DUF1918 domain-containing protein [Egibacteraceae bacterium]